MFNNAKRQSQIRDKAHGGVVWDLKFGRLEFVSDFGFLTVFTSLRGA